MMKIVEITKNGITNASKDSPKAHDFFAKNAKAPPFCLLLMRSLCVQSTSWIGKNVIEFEGRLKIA